MKSVTHIRNLALSIAFTSFVMGCSSAKDTKSAGTQNNAAVHASADSGMEAKMEGMPGMSGMMCDIGRWPDGAGTAHS